MNGSLRPGSLDHGRTPGRQVVPPGAPLQEPQPAINVEALNQRMWRIERTNRLLVRAELSRQRRRAATVASPTAQVEAEQFARELELELSR